MGAYSAYKALVIGVGCYADPQYDLSYARSDAEAMAEVLSEEFGFDQVWTLYDSDATRQNLIRFFEQDLQRTDEDDGLLIFFAGHGITVPSAIGDDRGFLVPYDGDPKQPYANLSLTTIRDDYMPMIPAKHVFFIVDSCYGGLALRDVAMVERPKSIDDAVLSELTRRDRKVRQVLSAGTKDQRVLDGGLFGHSVFTGRLIEALREATPYITADHVGVHVRERVARDSRDRHHRQTPQFGLLYGEGGAFVFRKHRPFQVPVLPDIAKHLATAQNLFEQGKFEQAAQEASDGLSKDPLSYELRKLRRDAEAGMTQAAEQQENKRRARLAQYAIVLCRNAKRFEADGDIERAIACLRQALEYDQNADVSAQLKRLSSKAEYGDLSIAAKLKAAFARAEKMESSDAEAALAVYEEALAIYPSNRRAQAGVERCQSRKAVQSIAKQLKMAADLNKKEKIEIEKTAEQLSNEIAEYESLAMDSEHQKAGTELVEKRARLQDISTVYAFYTGAMKIVSKAISLEDAVSAIGRSRNALGSATDIVLKGLDCDSSVLTALVPDVVAAKQAFDTWLRSVDEAVVTFNVNRKQSEEDYEAAVAAEKKRVQAQKSKRELAYEQALAEEDARVKAEQVELDRKWRSLSWLKRMASSRPVAKRATVKPPLDVKPRPISPPDLASDPPIPKFPSSAAMAFGVTCVELIPDRASDGTDMTKFKESIRGSMGDSRSRGKKAGAGRTAKPGSSASSRTTGRRHQSTKRTTIPFAKFVADELGFSAKRQEWLLRLPSEAIASLVRNDESVRVAHLGVFRHGDRKVEYQPSPDLSTTSQCLRTELRREHSLERDEIDDCLKVWALIYQYAMASVKGLSIKGFGRFSVDKNHQLHFAASALQKSRKATSRRGARRKR